MKTLNRDIQVIDSRKSKTNLYMHIFFTNYVFEEKQIDSKEFSDQI